MSELAEAPSAEMEKKPSEKQTVRMESVTFRVGEELFTLTYDDFVRAGIEDSWIVRRIGRDEDLLTAALNKLLNKQ